MKKTDYDTKVSGIKKRITDHDHDKYITTLEVNTFAGRVFNARLAQANLVTKTGFDPKLKILNKKINSNKTKHLLVENEIRKLNNFDAAYFRGRNVFDNDGTQNYLVFQPVYKYFEINSGKITLWEAKQLSNEKISSFLRLINTQPPISA